MVVPVSVLYLRKNVHLVHEHQVDHRDEGENECDPQSFHSVQRDVFLDIASVLDIDLGLILKTLGVCI